MHNWEAHKKLKPGTKSVKCLQMWLGNQKIPFIQNKERLKKIRARGNWQPLQCLDYNQHKPSRWLLPCFLNK